jgi:hypothetical protein
MEAKCSLLCSQEPATYPCLALNKFSPWPRSLFLSDAIFVLLSGQHLVFPSFLFQSGLSATSVYPFLISHMGVTFSVQLILLDVVIVLITPGEEYKLWSSALCNFHQIFSSESYSQEFSIWDQLIYACPYSSREVFSGKRIPRTNYDNI